MNISLLNFNKNKDSFSNIGPIKSNLMLNYNTNSILGQILRKIYRPISLLCVLCIFTHMENLLFTDVLETDWSQMLQIQYHARATPHPHPWVIFLLGVGLHPQGLSKDFEVAYHFRKSAHPMWSEMVQNGLKIVQMVIFAHQWNLPVLVKMTGKTDPSPVSLSASTS